MRSKAPGIFLLPVIAQLALSTVSSAQTNVELIIDSSGSMAQRIGGESKIAIAKKVLSDLIQDLPGDAQIAVRTYGRAHPSRDRNCEDIELLTPFGPNDSKRLLPAVQALKPNGMTPISASLEAAVKDFRGKQGQNNIIILLTDGQESCNADPCATAKALHEADIQLQVNVIGFRVQTSERGQLQCVAQRGGGKYYDAANAKELKVAASRIQEQIAPAAPSRFDVLAQANGGEVLLAPGDTWQKINDGKEQQFEVDQNAEAVFGFKGGGAATFDTFATLVPGVNLHNLQDFELFAGNDSTAGQFTSIGKFKAVNARQLKSPYQEFSFSPVTARLLKIKLYSGYGPSSYSTYLYEFRLFGKPASSKAAAAAKSSFSTNILAQSSGGKVLAPADANWRRINDGKEERVEVDQNAEVVFGFRNGEPATFDTFATLVPDANPHNLQDFELFAAMDSPAGKFTSIGKFKGTNAKQINSPYQEFHFAPVTAKYLKVKLKSGYGPSSYSTYLYEFKVMGKN